MNRHARYPQAWPSGHPWDGIPYHQRNDIWDANARHEPFSPIDCGDWHPHNPHDYRHQLYHRSDMQPRSRVPPRNHQGVSYIPSPWRHSNGSTGPGNIIHWNESALPHPHNKRRHMAFVWPSDGKRKSTIGRWKDILTSRGPDIFVTKHGDRPSRNQWRNNWLDSTPEDPYYNTHMDMPWAQRKKPYDFRERTYRFQRGPGDLFWSDATWPRRGADHYRQPLNYRCERGQWYNMAWAPFGGGSSAAWV